MKKNEKAAHDAVHIPGVLRYHELMLSDGVRNALLYKAIKRHVSRDTSFLDVGAGSGVWAILAAKLGAKRVVAIEVEECLIPVIHKLAIENGVADRIEIIHGNSMDVRLRGRFDVIVSELFGNNTFGKETVDAFVDLRERFLAPDGVLIPERLISYFVPVRTEASAARVPAKLPISCDYFKNLKLNFARVATLEERQRLKHIGKPQTVIDLDFRTVESKPLLKLAAKWNLSDVGRANAVAMTTRSVFAEGIEMDGFDSQSWGTTLYNFEPFLIKKGTLKFELDLDDERSIWSVSASGRGEKPKMYSPSFGQAMLRMHSQMTPHKKARAAQKTKKGR